MPLRWLVDGHDFRAPMNAAVPSLLEELVPALQVHLKCAWSGLSGWAPRDDVQCSHVCVGSCQRFPPCGSLCSLPRLALPGGFSGRGVSLGSVSGAAELWLAGSVSWGSRSSACSMEADTRSGCFPCSTSAEVPHHCLPWP